jgi:four helix bundle protein
MATPLEGLRVLQQAEALADAIWKDVLRWDAFARESMGSQLVRASDSVGANIAEAFGRFHYGEKLQFIYFARGSIFETNYWLNRALARLLLPPNVTQHHASELTNLARQLNAFAANIKKQRTGTTEARQLREPGPEYVIGASDADTSLFTEDELVWLETLTLSDTNLQSPISDLL